MATIGLTKQTTPARSVYDGSGNFQATAGQAVRLESTGSEHVDATVSAGETWAVRWTMHVVVS